MTLANMNFFALNISNIHGDNVCSAIL